MYIFFKIRLFSILWFVMNVYKNRAMMVVCFLSFLHFYVYWFKYKDNKIFVIYLIHNSQIDNKGNRLV